MNFIVMILTKIGESILVNRLPQLIMLIAEKIRLAFFKKNAQNAADELKKAGTKPELTPEQKAKEIENAFDSVNRNINP
mgnify:CR=1 FL=1